MAYDKLVQVEETTYIPVVLEILWNGNESRQERKLIRFSVVSFVEQYLKEHDFGIVFSKNEHVVAVLKGARQQDAKQILYELMEEQFRSRIRHTLERYPYLVAERGGKILGYAYAGTFNKRAANGIVLWRKSCSRWGLRIWKRALQFRRWKMNI